MAHQTQPSVNSSATASAGTGLLGLITIVLLVFKLGAIAGTSWGINMSWWWVFSPLLFGFGLSILMLLVLFVVILAVNVFSK